MNANSPADSDDFHYNDRQYDRKDVAIDAYVRPIGEGKSLVKVLDVSETGFRMNTAVTFNVDKGIFLSMPGFQSLEAVIIWHRENLYGCTFLAPLHPAILDHISRVFAEQKNKYRSL